jgi:hypothetical protein
LAHAIRASQTDLKIKFHAVDPHTSLTWQKGFKVDDFYAARSGTIPPLAWTNIAPPFSDAVRRSYPPYPVLTGNARIAATRVGADHQQLHSDLIAEMLVGSSL